MPFADPEQLALLFDDEPAPGPADEPVSLPQFFVSEEKTPGAIIDWWYELVGIFTAGAREAKTKVAPLEAEITALKGQRTGEARRRKAQLREERDRIFARAEATEFEAYGMFEAALEEFTPRLIELMKTEGVVLESDGESEIASFWDCLHRPDIEYCSDMPLREIVRHFCREAVPAEECAGGGATALSAGNDNRILR